MRQEPYSGQKRYGGTGGESATGIAVDASGNVYVTGWFASDTLSIGTTMLLNSGTASSDLFMAKLDPSGNEMWAFSKGSTGNDRGQDICVDASGNIFVTGWYASPSINFGNGPLTNSGSGTNDIFVVKFNSAGSALWSKTIGGTNNEAAYACKTDATGNLYVTGSYASASINFGAGALTNTQTGFHDFFLNKYDASGNSLWSRTASGMYDDIGYSIAISGANVYVCGAFGSPTVQFGTTPALSNPGNPTSDIFLAQYTASGTANWSLRAGGVDDELGRCIAADANGNVYMTGNYISANINFGTGTLTNNGQGTKELYVAAFNSSGNCTWSLSVGSTGDECGYGIASSPNADMIYVGGMFNSGFVVFGSTTIYKGCGDDVFIAKFGTVTGVQENLQTGNSFIVYPNPAADVIHVNVPNATVCEIFDATGKIVLTSSATAAGINVAALPPGIYFITNRYNEKTVRFVKK